MNTKSSKILGSHQAALVYTHFFFFFFSNQPLPWSYFKVLLTRLAICWMNSTKSLQWKNLNTPRQHLRHWQAAPLLLLNFFPWNTEHRGQPPLFPLQKGCNLSQLFFWFWGGLVTNLSWGAVCVFSFMGIWMLFAPWITYLLLFSTGSPAPAGSQLLHPCLWRSPFCFHCCCCSLL